ncbi:MAG: energy transducer TonB [Acidobacteriota bacterium]|nr:energy transducer TonB [Acidobacteriota bacterium]
MFTNLIESSSHSSEFKRRGSFFLFTATTYLLLFAIAGVMSIYAYDARLADQKTEIITMLNPVDFAEPASAPVRPLAGPSRGSSSAPGFIRTNPTATVDDPQIVPTTASATPSTNAPLPPGVLFKVGDHDADPGAIGPGGLGVGGTGDKPANVPLFIEVGSPPKLERIQKPAPKVISKGVINGQAVSLPKPPYPPIAKQLRIQGTVNVQVLINEAGNVVSAKAISGNPALITAAQSAAFAARFSPTLLGDQPVKVSGVIIYNFVLQ